MTPKRTQIRAAVASAIASRFNTVKPYRTFLQPDQLPGACVYIVTGTPEIDHESRYDYDAVMVVEMAVHGFGDLDAELDALEQHVNADLEADVTLGGVIEGMTRAGFDSDQSDEDAIMSLSLMFQINYDEE